MVLERTESDTVPIDIIDNETLPTTVDARDYSGEKICSGFKVFDENEFYAVTPLVFALI